MKTYEQLEKALSRTLILLVASWIVMFSSLVTYINVLDKNEVLQKGVVKSSATVDMDTVEILSLQERIAELESANEELIRLSGDKK